MPESHEHRRKRENFPFGVSEETVRWVLPEPEDVEVEDARTP